MSEHLIDAIGRSVAIGLGAFLGIVLANWTTARRHRREEKARAAEKVKNRAEYLERCNAEGVAPDTEIFRAFEAMHYAPPRNDKAWYIRQSQPTQRDAE